MTPGEPNEREQTVWPNRCRSLWGLMPLPFRYLLIIEGVWFVSKHFLNLFNESEDEHSQGVVQVGR